MIAYCKHYMGSIVTESDCNACPKLDKTFSKDYLCDFYVEEGDFKKIRSQLNDIEMLIYIIHEMQALAWNGSHYKKCISQGILDMINVYLDEIKAINDRS
jgi:hypothetical protein